MQLEIRVKIHIYLSTSAYFNFRPKFREIDWKPKQTQAAQPSYAAEIHKS